MELALLLLPLVGGYLFSQTWYPTKFKSSKEDGHRLYFRSAFYAAILFAVAMVLRFLLLKLGFYRSFEDLLQTIAVHYVASDPMPTFSLGVTSIYSLGLGFVSGYALNFVTSRDLSVFRSIADDDFERLLHDAIDLDLPISATMENDKVYIGFVLTTSDVLRGRMSFTILPLISGYRDERRELVMTTFYGDAYEQMSERKMDDTNLTPDDFRIVLPKSKIQSVNLFDLTVYEMFKQENTHSRKKAKRKAPKKRKA